MLPRPMRSSFRTFFRTFGPWLLDALITSHAIRSLPDQGQEFGSSFFFTAEAA
jgi:hypothetical protein